MKYTSETLNRAICEAVGINPDTVHSIVVECRAGEIVKVTTHGYAETDDGKIDHLMSVLREYELKPRKGGD